MGESSNSDGYMVQGQQHNNNNNNNNHVASNYARLNPDAPVFEFEYFYVFFFFFFF